MGLTMTPQKFWELAGSHQTSTYGFDFATFMRAYENIAPSGVMYGALGSGAWDGLGIRVVELQCHRDAIPAGAGEIMMYAQTIAGFAALPTAGDALVLISTSPNDDLGNTGAEYVRVEYIDGQGAEQHVDVEMNGAANVPTGITIPNPVGSFAVNGLKVVQAGAVSTNVGDITLEDVTNTRVYEAIQAGMGRSQTCRYHVPVGKRAFVFRLECAAEVEDVVYGLFAHRQYDYVANERILCREAYVALPESGRWEHIFSDPVSVPPTVAGEAPSSVSLLCLSVGGASEGTASVFMAVCDEE